MPNPDFDAAVKEAYASAPSDVIVYNTLEISHPDFAAPIRVVQGFDNITASGATWTAVPFELVLPPASDLSPPQLQLRVDNVSRELLEGIEAAAESAETISVTYRGYLSTDLNDPYGEVAMSLTNISVTPTVITATAGLVDFANKRFPRETYRDDVFPGLIT